MLGFVHNLLSVQCNPIGVDFGTDCLRLAQVQEIDREYRLVAAASALVPTELRSDPQARLEFFTQTTTHLISRSEFQGRQAVLALPASMMCVEHLRVTRVGNETLESAIAREAQGKLPIDPSTAILRHIESGDDHDSPQDVFVMAASREWINQFLAAAAQAGLDVVGMNVEPKALTDCFSHIFQRRADTQATLCYVDIGSSGTRVTISRNSKILMVRSIAIGGDHLTQSAAEAMHISFEEARALRIKLAAKASGHNFRKRREDGGAVAQLEQQPAPASDWSSQIEDSGSAALDALAQALETCRHDYELGASNALVDRLIFVGAEARHSGLCRRLSRDIGLPSQVGDPLCRMNPRSAVGIESGIDRRQPQPAWATAIGLSMGPRVEAE
jgi:type IV pilus assembly protein PilM